MSDRDASQDQSAEQRVEASLLQLLEATQALSKLLGEEAPESELEAAYARRLEAFEALRCVTDGRSLVGRNSRRLLAQVRRLDAELLEGAQSIASALRADRSTITRARHAISAHTAKERSEPRLLAVRA